MCDCEFKDILLEARRAGRFNYYCPKCGDDISMKVIFIAEAEMKANEILNKEKECRTN